MESPLVDVREGRVGRERVPRSELRVAGMRFEREVYEAGKTVVHRAGRTAGSWIVPVADTTTRIYQATRLALANCANERECQTTWGSLKI